MNQLVAIKPALALPAIVAAADARVQLRFMEFFAANIRNPNTRKAYARATAAFLAWCTAHDVQSISEVMPLHVAGYIEVLGQQVSVPTVKQYLAAIRHRFDWLVVGQIELVDPAGSVRGPSHSVRRGWASPAQSRRTVVFLTPIKTTFRLGRSNPLCLPKTRGFGKNQRSSRCGQPRSPL